MVRAEQRRKQPRREATSATLRLLAALVALLLSASSLGQIAHFLLVPHAICAQHGELVELTEAAAQAGAQQSEHADADDDVTSGSPRISAQEATSHDHCEILARGQREQALPAASVVALLPAAAESALELLAVSTARPSLSKLSLAPKTSPPRVAALV